MFAKHFVNNHNLTVNEKSSVESNVEERLSQLSRDRNYIVKFSVNSPAAPIGTFATNFSSDILTTPDVILDISSSRNNKSSCGIDNMPYRLLKLFSIQIIEYLCILFNHCIACGHFPLKWKHVIVIPIPKGGKDTNLVSNWRPISLLNCLSKVFERVIVERVMNHNMANNVIPNHQFGFQPHHSTCHPLAILQNKINHGLNTNQMTTVISLDIRAAFDTVCHKGLIFKLIKNKFPTYLVRILNSFLSNRSFQVIFSNYISDVCYIPAGVPQGSILGPVLFNISNCDIPVDDRFTLLQYADDTAIVISYPRIYRIDKYVNNYLLKLSNWYKQWKFKLNVNKTEMIHMVGTQNNVSWIRRVRLRKLIIKLDGITIEPKATIKHLGVYFSRNNRFNVHIENTLQKTIIVKQSIGALVHDQLLDPSFNKFLYTMYILPVLTYASIVWLHPNQITSFQVERCRVLERKLIRSTHNIHRNKGSYRFLKNTRLYELYGKSGLDVYMVKMSINFHKKCNVSLNPEICKLHSVYSTNVNFATGFFHRTDYILNLHNDVNLFNNNDELFIFNRKKFFRQEPVNSMAQ